MKVIQILHHSPPSGVDFWEGILEGWHSKLSKAIKRYDNKVEIECWQPIIFPEGFDFVRNDIRYRLFPSVQPHFFATFSPQLLYALNKEIRKDRRVILHIHGDRTLMTYQILKFFAKKQTNVAIQHHGSGGESIFTPIEKRLLKRARKIYVVSRDKEKYLRRLRIEKEKIRIQTMGVNYEIFKPLAESHAREKLNIEQDKFAILYVGKFYKRKGLIPILRAFKKLKQKYDVCLLLVGGQVDDPLYPYITKISKRNKESLIVKLRLPNSQMPLIYSASDVMCWYINNTPIWGGIGVTVIESLACNTPVISNTLIHFANENEIDEVGLIPESEDQIGRCIEEIINGEANEKCREISRKYYDWKVIVENILKDYHELID